jgi:uncharacterized RDD family membrane protein YckC
MSYLVGELERRGIRVLAQLESGNSSLVCTATELLAWDGMNVQRVALTSIAKVSHANGVLEISDASSVQIRLGLKVESNALSSFFAQVKTATQTAKAQVVAAPPLAQPESVALPRLEPERQIIPIPERQVIPVSEPQPEATPRVTENPTSLGRSQITTMRMSDYADPLQAHALRSVTSAAPKPKKYTDVRGKIYDELGFSFEYATVFDRFKAKFIDGILVGIAQRGLEFLLMRGLTAKTKQLEDLERSIGGFLTSRNGVPENADTLIQQYLQLAASLAGEQLRVSLLASLGSLLLGWLYYALLESGPKYGTFGKQAARIGVVDYALERISFGQATMRYFSSILPAFVIIFLMFALTAPLVAQAALLFVDSGGTFSDKAKVVESLGKRLTGTVITLTVVGAVAYLVIYCWAFFDKHRQTLYDLAAKTLVIRA